MIVALLNHQGGIRKTTLALHLAGQWGREGKRVTVIDADPQGSAVAGLMRWALLSADLILIPAQPSPSDGWASAETLGLLREARIFGPQPAARFVLARDTADRLTDHDPPVLASRRIGQRVVFAEVARTGGRVSDLDTRSQAFREVAALATEVGALAP
jgi:chromosome partitioning protein